MAYLKTLLTKCQTTGCTQPATVEVFNRANASIGRFCRRDGERQLERLQKTESRQASQAAADR